MLKFTYSFCRFSNLTYQNITYNNIGKSVVHLSYCKKTCLTWNSRQLLVTPFVVARVQSRLLASIKKRFRGKKSQVISNVTKTPKQMSEFNHPTLTHFSYGGEFECSTVDGSSNSVQDNSNIGEQKKCNIPSDFRIWETVGKKTSSYHGGFRFKVTSYNVLAQYLLECHPYLYTECVPKNLKWKKRAAKIYDEIISLSPDILCLQEVQVSHLNSFYTKFEQNGYFGVFKQKTGHRQDGCAIYFKQSLFDMQDHINVEYYQPELPILNRDNIGLVLKLAPKDSPDTPIVVATTHLLYNPKRTDVRLAQMQILLAEIDRFAYSTEGKEPGYLPIILTGDFNSTPESAVVQLLDRGHVSASPFRDTSDWKRIGVTDNCQHLSVYLNRQKGISTDFSMIKIYNSDYTVNTSERINNSHEYSELFNSGDIGHPLKLTSVYHTVKSDGHLEATTFQDYWVTVDYIYFSCCSNLQLVERLRLPTATECESLGKLPNDRYGSDHLALAATFELRRVVSSL